jgi:hypothetical protein
MEMELSLEAAGASSHALRLLEYFVGEGISSPSHLEVPGLARKLATVAQSSLKRKEVFVH